MQYKIQRTKFLEDSSNSKTTLIHPRPQSNFKILKFPHDFAIIFYLIWFVIVIITVHKFQ